MRSRLSHVALAATLLAALAQGACKKTGSEPGGYGVNITIDATALTSAQRGTITVATMTVVDTTKTASTPVKRMLDILAPLKGGVVHFHYTPGTDVDTTDVLRFGVDVLAGTALVSSGSSPDTTLVPMKAVDALIKLAGVGDGGVSPADGGDGGAGKINGIACVTDDECGSGFCTDGVCCNEKCDDVCVSCNQTPTKGTCTPYAADTDPELECAPKNQAAPIPDAGTATGDGSSEEGASDASEADASEAGAASADGGSDGAPSDALVLNEPDGGFVTMPTACGGVCGGARACKFPGATTSCGHAFCNTAKYVAAFTCDGNGSCIPAVTACKDYVCDDATSACKTICAAHSDCQAGEYCDNHACVPKNANGLACTTADECASGYCSTSVCCNTSCGGAGQSCNPGGGLPAGSCQCLGVNCGAAACQVFYQDLDGDGYGNANGSLAFGSTTAKAGCMGATPPAGYVADNTDCDDGDANVHPGQTAFFGTPSKGVGTYDYNCDKNTEKQTPEYPGASCRFCGPTSNCAATTTSCTSTSQTESFQCPLEGSRPIIEEEPVAAFESIASPALTSRASGIIPIQPIYTYCCGCRAADKSGFTIATSCGASNYVYTCGSCNGSTANPESAVRTQQLCR